MKPDYYKSTVAQMEGQISWGHYSEQYRYMLKQDQVRCCHEVLCLKFISDQDSECSLGLLHDVHRLKETSKVMSHGHHSNLRHLLET